MQPTKTRRSSRFGLVLAALLIVAELVAQVAVFHPDVMAASAESSPEPAPALPEGISLTEQLTEDDAAYLQESLQLLHDQLPEWWQYVMDTRPLVFSFDEELAAHQRAAVAECCDAQGRGVVKFGYHFGQLTMSDDPDEKALEARRVTFLGLLIHELTHIRDLRTGRFTVKTDRQTCVASESSGLTMQLQFKRDLATIVLTDDPATAETLGLWLNRQIKAEASDLRSRAFWDWYCGGFDN